jgi:hypothetical protein
MPRPQMGSVRWASSPAAQGGPGGQANSGWAAAPGRSRAAGASGERAGPGGIGGIAHKQTMSQANSNQVVRSSAQWDGRARQQAAGTLGPAAAHSPTNTPLRARIRLGRVGRLCQRPQRSSICRGGMQPRIRLGRVGRLCQRPQRSSICRAGVQPQQQQEVGAAAPAAKRGTSWQQPQQRAGGCGAMAGARCRTPPPPPRTPPRPPGITLPASRPPLTPIFSVQ